MTHEVIPAESGPRTLDLRPPEPIDVKDGAGRWNFRLEKKPDGYSVRGVPGNSDFVGVNMTIVLKIEYPDRVYREDESARLVRGEILPTHAVFSPLEDDFVNGKVPDLVALQKYIESWKFDFMGRNELTLAK
ncbi:MAG: hypothetical protein AAB473_01510 [Patescibacteria group bacterium]